MIELLAPLLDLVQIAHETDFFHEEPVRSTGGGAGVVVIVAAIAVSVLAVVGLIWLKRRVDG